VGYLLDSQWENGSGVEDLKIWGTSPLFNFLDMFDKKYCQDCSGKDTDEFGVFLYYQMKNILLDMGEVIDRFIEEARNERKTKMSSQDERLLSLVSKLPDSKKDHIETLLREAVGTGKAIIQGAS